MAVNLVVDLGDRFGADAHSRAVAGAAKLGLRLLHAARVDDRLAAWIDWQFAPSWWSAEARAGEAWYAVDARGDVAGFAAFDARGLRFPWLRGYERQRDIGIFGPYGVAPEHRGTILGEALLAVALGALRAKGYARALIPAVGYERLIAMYQARTGAVVADTYSYDAPRRYRTTILASGSGTNFSSVMERVAAGVLPLEVVAVVTNSSTAGVIARAAAANVDLKTVVWERPNESRAAFDARVIDAVARTETELVLLLGWMHLLPPAFVERFGEILNVHPAFLPLDPERDDVTLPDGSVLPVLRGAHALRDALVAGVQWTGASVHRVTADVDRGEVLVRTPVRIDRALDLKAMSTTLRPVEHAAVGAAIRRWCFARMATDNGAEQ